MVQRARNGNWKVRWRDKGEGIMRAKTFSRKVDAEKFEAELKLGLRFKVEAQNNTTFEEFASRWLSDHCEVHKAPSQHKTDRRMVDRYLRPAFEGKLLRELSRRDLISLQAELAKSGELKPKTINNITGLARKILQDAFHWEYLKGNPFAGVTSLIIPEQPFRFWSFDEARRFLNVCRSRDRELHDYVLFILHTGLRKGEIEGLLRDSIDLDRRMIIVRRTFNSRVPVKLQEFTKSKKVRRIWMNEIIYNLLKDKALLAPSQRLFGYKQHSRFYKMSQLAQVQVISFHDLRHTFASHMVMNGVPIRELKDVLGHSETRVTERYAHLSPGFLDRVTDCLVPTAVPTNLDEGDKSLKDKEESLCHLPGSNRLGAKTRKAN